MALFELDDGDLQKFWEVVLEGEVLSFRFGDLGTSGRTRTRRYPSERRAKSAYDEAVRAMRAQGYRRKLDVPVVDDGPPDPVWSQLEADPDDPVALAVHADWLQSQGDVRGEVLALELAGLPAEANALFELNAASLKGPVDRFPGNVELEWRFGYVRAVRFEPSDHRGVDPAGTAAALLGSPAFRLVQEVELQVPSATEVAVARPLPAVRRLVLHTGVVGVDLHPAEPLDLDRLGRCMPRLTSLKVRGVSELVGGGALQTVETLDVRFAPGWVDRLRAGLPRLKRLAVHGVDEDSVRQLAGLGRFAELDSLELTPSWGAAPTLVAALSGRPGPSRLTLSGVDLDTHHVRLLESIDGLESLAVDGTLTPQAHSALQRSSLTLENEVRIVDGADDDEAEPVRPDDLVVQRFEYVSRKSRRFWEIGRDATVHHVRYGRLGSRGRWIWRRFPNDDIAEEMLQKRIDEKLREGYQRCEMRVVFDARGE